MSKAGRENREANSQAMNYPIKLELSVAWGEMDAFGHVNNVVFFRYFESVRIAYFRAICPDGIGKDGLVPILASTECNYRMPVYFPDTLVGEASISHVGTSSFTMVYRLTSKEQDAVVAEGKAVVVNVNPETGKSEALSDKIKQRISKLEEQTT